MQVDRFLLTQVNCMIAKAKIGIYLVFASLLVIDSPWAWPANTEHAKNCTAELLSEEILISLPPLIMSYEGKVFWKGRQVRLSHVHGKQRELLWRLLVALADRANEATTMNDLIADLWPINPGERRDLKKDYNQILVTIINKLDGAFKQVDPTFDNIRSWSDETYAWDTHVRYQPQIIRGAVVFPGLRELYWRGQKIDLDVSEFNFVYRLLTLAKGETLSFRHALDIISHGPGLFGGADQIQYYMKNYIKSIQGKFKKFDPNFNRILIRDNNSFSWID